MTIVQNVKKTSILEEFGAEFRELLNKYDLRFDKFSMLFNEIRHQKTFQLREKYNKFNLKTQNIKELEIDIHRDSIEEIEERYRAYFSDKTREDRIKQIVNSMRLQNYKTIEDIEEIKRYTSKEVYRLNVQSYNGHLKFHLYEKYRIRIFISELRELFSYLNHFIYSQDDINFTDIENHEVTKIADNLNLVFYKNQNIKICHVKKPEANERDILGEIYALFKQYASSNYYFYL